jgi:hypothetical protein
MGQDLDKVENLYDTVANEYAETFSGEHEKKPKDQEMLNRFSQEIGVQKTSLGFRLWSRSNCKIPERPWY